MYSETLWWAADRLTGLGALGHLDLDLVGVDQIFGGDTRNGPEATCLIDERRLSPACSWVTLDTAGTDDLGQRVGWLIGMKRFGSSPPPHRCSSGRRMRFMATASVVGFGGDRAQGRGASGKALDDLLGGLDLFQRHRAPAGLSSNRPRRVM